MRRRSFKARSADGPMMFPALEMHYPVAHRIVEDQFAVRMLSPAMRATVRALAWPPFHTLLTRQLDRQMPGLAGTMVARKRYADDQVAAALEAGIRQFVILGAGLDTRGFRMITPAGGHTFEVDLPQNSKRKAGKLNRLFGAVPSGLELVAVDFETDDLTESLASQGFRPELPTMYVVEAVTQYLTGKAVDELFAATAKAAPSSRLIFTYVQRDFLDGRELHGWDKVHREWVVEEQFWTFGLAPSEVASFLQRYGWTEVEQVGAPQYEARYLRQAGRDEPVTDLERFVSAEKPESI